MKNKQHTLAYIKRQAKKLKKESSISHTEALEIISKLCGYSNWMHCYRSLNQQKTDEVKIVDESVELSFTNWLKRHSNRNSPLGDLAQDTIRDKTWPSYNSLNDYRFYLSARNASYAAVEALGRAWKSYRAYLRRKKVPNLNKRTTKKPAPKNYDQRKIVYVRDAAPVQLGKRTVEKFVPGDKAWISWDGQKAIPVTVTEVNDRHYSLKIERPIKKAGSSHFLYLDEVRSTPELACMNYVTF